ncbi:MAG: ATP-binding cassette domain-containing protein [Methanoregulaceae archaeon]|nr:ATP-binding cassette domain-containing protein [Methanoregulaceae archaeon]
MLETRDLVKSFSGPGGEVRAVTGVTLRVANGEFCMVIGPDSCGKSTLAGMIGGLTPPSSGKVLIRGEDIWAGSQAKLSRIRGRSLGLIFPSAGLLPNFSIQENIELPAYVLGSTLRIEIRAEQLLARVGLEGKGQVLPAGLSQCELVRAEIARALINDPGLIIADDPVCGLSGDEEEQVMRIFSGLHREGKTILLMTTAEGLAGYAGRVIRMVKGKLL